VLGPAFTCEARAAAAAGPVAGPGREHAGTTVIAVYKSRPDSESARPVISLARVNQGRSPADHPERRHAPGRARRVRASPGAPKSGRTTLLRVIATLIRPTSGGLSVDGIDAMQRPGGRAAQVFYVSPDA
jgi:hypothetical protein